MKKMIAAMMVMGGLACGQGVDNPTVISTNYVQIDWLQAQDYARNTIYTYTNTVGVTNRTVNFAQACKYSTGMKLIYCDVYPVDTNMATTSFEASTTIYAFLDNSTNVLAKYTGVMSMVGIASNAGSSVYVADATKFATNDVMRIINSSGSINHRYLVDRIAGNVLTVKPSTIATYGSTHFAVECIEFGGFEWANENADSKLYGNITWANAHTGAVQVLIKAK